VSELHGDLNEGLRRAAASRSEQLRRKIDEALSCMEKEIEENNSLYPHNGGAITQAEVCRRAGIRPTSLGAPTQSASKKKVDQWCAKWQRYGTRKEAHQHAVGRVTQLKDDHDKVKEHYMAFKLLYNELETELAELKKRHEFSKQENHDLVLENRKLKAMLARINGDTKVIPLHGNPK
jgi:DNA repair exonuclease SbcCD ATPase subunit